MADRTPVEWAMLPLKRYAQFNGRAPRSEYWWFYLFTVIVDRVLTFVDGRALGQEMLLSGIFGLIIILPWIAVTIRRLHDTGRSGWWLLMPLVPIAMIVALAFDSTIAGTDGIDEDSWTFLGSIALFIITGIVLFVFMVLPGTPAPNRFGPDPHGRANQLEEIFS